MFVCVRFFRLNVDVNSCVYASVQCVCVCLIIRFVKMVGVCVNRVCVSLLNIFVYFCLPGL